MPVKRHGAAVMALILILYREYTSEKRKESREQRTESRE
jgi:hypothetical protein